MSRWEACVQQLARNQYQGVEALEALAGAVRSALHPAEGGSRTLRLPAEAALPEAGGAFLRMAGFEPFGEGLRMPEESELITAGVVRRLEAAAREAQATRVAAAKSAYRGEEPAGYLWFYRDREVPYGCFSNFSAHPILLHGQSWKTTEHYFQAMKFHQDQAVVDQVRATGSPGQAAKLGRNRSLPLRKDWEAAKLGIMREAVEAKFTQHPHLREILMSTGKLHLVEHTRNDTQWADGGAPDWTQGAKDTNVGKNYLGIILTELRDKWASEEGEGEGDEEAS